MTLSDKIERAPPASAPGRHHLATELIETLKLAAPMALTQLGQIAMMTTDLAFIGRLGDAAVGAAALAGTVYFIAFTIGLGLMSAVAPLAAQAFGAGDPRMVRRSVRSGLWMGLLISLPIMIAPLRGEQILHALGQAAEPSRLAQDYLFGLVWGVAPALWFIAIRGFMGAVNRPQPILWITLAAIPLNALLVYVLVYGKFGAPQLGLLGAGLGTATVNICTFLVSLWIAIRQDPFRRYHILARLWRIDWELMRQIAVIGTPISFALMLEWGLFSSAALLMGIISTTALAAHQIALQVTAVLFMIPLGISMAATVRVGQAVGAKDIEGVKRAGVVAIGLGIAISAALTVAVIALRFDIARLFLGESLPNVEATVALAGSLLLIGGSFFIMDGLQGVAAGALRGLNDTRVPLAFAAISYWGVGFCSAYLMAFHTSLGAEGVWIGLSIGSFVYAALLTSRFRLLASRLVL